jgi:hypothetical protein
MNRRHIVSLAAVPVLLVAAAASAQVTPPAAAPADQPAPPPESVEAPKPRPAPPEPPPAASALATSSNKFQMSIYGFAKLDTIVDDTQSLNEVPGNMRIDRYHPGLDCTPQGCGTSHGRTMFTARDSRFGFKVAAPEWEGMKASAQIEADFGGGPAGGNVSQASGPTSQYYGSTVTYITGRYPPYSNNYGNEEAYTTTGTVRLRLAYFKMETKYVDILAGQYWSLLGWSASPFFSNTVTIGGSNGAIFNRNPQIRLSKVIKTNAVDVEIATGAFRGVQRDARIPDIEGGIKVSINGWKGIHQVGYGQPTLDALQIGVSGLYRTLKIIEFADPPQNYVKLYGWGAAVDAYLPIIGRSKDNMSNALCLTGEYNTGSGISDMYLGLTGGLDYFQPIDMGGGVNMAPTVYYRQNIDNGIVGHITDPNIMGGLGTFVPIKWTGIVAGAQYHLPIYDGKLIWLSALYGQIKSSNIATVDVPPEGAFKKSEYMDASLWFGLGPAVQLGFMYMTMQSTYVDDRPSMKNHRGQGAFMFFF